MGQSLAVLSVHARLKRGAALRAELRPGRIGGPALGAVHGSLRDRRRVRGRGLHAGPRRRFGDLLALIRFSGGAPELADTLADGSTHLRQPADPEDDDHYSQDQNELEGADAQRTNSEHCFPPPQPRGFKGRIAPAELASQGWEVRVTGSPSAGEFSTPP